MKNYTLYLRKLMSYARQHNIKVFFVESKIGSYGYGTELGWFSPRTMSVFVSKDLNKSSQIAIFLHELGHHQDEIIYLRYKDAMNNAYIKYNAGKKLSKKQRLLIVECETSAWNSAEKIAKDLRIPLGKWFFTEKEKGLSYYRDIPSHPIKK